MPLDLARLENVRTASGKTTAACPACREAGHDKAGNHLFVKPDGGFGCVAYPGDRPHRQRIAQLAGLQEPQRQPSAPAPAPAKRQPRTWPDAQTAAEAIAPNGHQLADLYLYGLDRAVARYENGPGKTFRQLHREDAGWTTGAAAGQWPLFGKVPDNGVIFIGEGEKVVQAAETIGLPAVTSAGGCSSPAKTDWTPLAGREVVILPDADEPGEKYAAEVESILASLDPPARVRIVRLPDLPPSGDLADFLDARDATEPAQLKAEIERLSAIGPPEAEVVEDTQPRQQLQPWQQVDASHVREAIAGTLLADMVSVLQDVTIPALPLEITLAKALALAGTALSQPVDFDPKTETRRGLDLARVLIATSFGQACNVWAVIVAPSGTGKDIGYLPSRIANKAGLALGHSGSAEGLADALITNGAGLLTLSELQNYLNPHRWEHSACSFLTQAFNIAHAKVALSKRTGGSRDIRYCVPSILANVQEEVIAAVSDRILLDSGFFSRFLVSHYAATQSWRPNAADVDISPLQDAFDVYRQIRARVTVPQDYLQDVLDEFVHHGASIPSHYNRLVNEYGARFAVMLATNPDSPFAVEISPDHWRRAGIMIRWFYAQAERVLSRLGETRRVRVMEDRLGRMLDFIRKHPKGIDKRTFSQVFHRGSTAEERDKDIRELADRGAILILREGRRTILVGAK